MTKTLLRCAVIAATLMGLMLLMGGAQEVYGQTYRLAPLARYQPLDASGNPVASGHIHTYACGTTTARSTFSNSTGTTNANPVTLDSSGRATIYLDTSLCYRFIVHTSAEVEVYDQDNIQWVTPGSFTITSNVVPRGTGVAGGLSDGSITDDLTTVTIDPSGAISILGSTTINGGLTVTNGTLTATGNITLGAVTVTSCTGCSSTVTRYIPFLEDAIVIQGVASTVLTLTTQTLAIDLPFGTQSIIGTNFRVPPDTTVTQPITLVLNYTLSANPGTTNNIVRLITQAGVNSTWASATAGDSITLANNVLPASYTATVNVVAGSTYAVGDYIQFAIRRDVSVANNAQVGFRILTIGWTYTSSQ